MARALYLWFRITFGEARPLLSRSELDQRSREAGITEGLAKRARESPEVARSGLLAPRVRETSGEAKTFSLLPNRVIAILPIRVMGLTKSWVIVVG